MMNSNEPASDETKAPTAVATDPVGQLLSSPRRGKMTSTEYRDVLDLLALTHQTLRPLYFTAVRLSAPHIQLNRKPGTNLSAHDCR